MPANLQSRVFLADAAKLLVVADGGVAGDAGEGFFGYGFVFEGFGESGLPGFPELFLRDVAVERVVVDEADEFQGNLLTCD
jgi:hypothetical protein